MRGTETWRLSYKNIQKTRFYPLMIINALQKRSENGTFVAPICWTEAIVSPGPFSAKLTTFVGLATANMIWNWDTAV